MQKIEPKSLLLFPSDKNGCGFYRTFLPFRFLAAKHQEFHISEFYSFFYDMNYLRRSNWIRFQRQVTDAQKKIITQYKLQLAKHNPRGKIAYELDDLVHGITPNNILAYQFYTPSRKNNLIDIFRMSNMVTFSTNYLKKYYEDNYQINNAVVIPNYLPKYLWGGCGKREKRRKDKSGKPRVLWAGSASHLGKGGDLEFLIPLIRKTHKEIQWVFFGCKPFELDGMVEFHDWANVYEYASKLDAIDADVAISPILDIQFNYGKSDLKLLEYSALGIPTIASSIGNKCGPYDLIANSCTLENKMDIWYTAIMQHFKDNNVWQRTLDAGKTELEKRWLENEENIGLYKSLYEK